ncbi:MAG: hypothetical protein FWE87_05595, partial [Coriobacteriia bacterium]|nr:hypothetical protein [Coriobacteriia bacterium]
MTSKKKLLSIVAVLLLIGLIAVPAIAGGATEATEPVRGTVDYDGVYLSALGLLIFLGSALAVYLIVKKRKFMFKPLVDEVIPMSEPVD